MARLAVHMGKIYLSKKTAANILFSKLFELVTPIKSYYSKKIANDQEIDTIESHISLSKLGGKEARAQKETKSDIRRTVHQMSSSFLNRWTFSYPNCKQQQHLFLPILYLNYKRN